MSEAAKFDIAKLELKPGDILVLRINAPRLDVTQQRIDNLRKAAIEKLPEGVTAMVIGPEVEISTITREQAGPLIKGTAKPKKGTPL